MTKQKAFILATIIGFCIGIAAGCKMGYQEVISPVPEKIISPIPDETPAQTEEKEKLGEAIRKSIEDALDEEFHKVAKITAYSCGGLKTLEEIHMNCPSLLSGKPRTATGTEPIPYKTVACDRANIGRTFHIDGVGRVTCTDTGGAITGAGRFDLYVSDVQEARQWGVKMIAYKEIINK